MEHGRTGLLVPPKDVMAMADAMRRLARDSTLRETMGQVARARYCAEFSIERMSKAVTVVYDEVLANDNLAAHRP